METRSETVLALAREIIAIESRLDEKKRELAMLVGDESPTGARQLPPETPVASKPPAGGAFIPKGQTKPGSAADRIKAYLSARVGQAIPLRAVIAAMPEFDPKRVSAEAARLAREPSNSGVQNVGRGLYQYAVMNGTHAENAA